MTKTFDNLPWIVRLIIIILFGWLVGGIYRVIKWTETKNTVTLVAGLLGLFTGIGNLVTEVVDLVTTILGSGISVLAD